MSDKVATVLEPESPKSKPPVAEVRKSDELDDSVEGITDDECTYDVGRYKYEEDVGKEVEIPFLMTVPYDFEQLVSSDSLTYREEDRERWILVTDQHVPTQTSITDAYGVARCQFLKQEPTPENVSYQIKELTWHKKRYLKVCRQFMERFLVTLSPELDITYDGNKKVENWSHILTAFCQVKSRKEVEKFVVLMYISFDFINSYRAKICNAVLRQIGIRIIKKSTSNRDKSKDRKRISCFESMTSTCLNGYRKSLSRMGVDTCGWSITNIRPGYVFNEENEYEYRDRKKIYHWMINGKQNIGYDDSKRKRRHRRNIITHNYPKKRSATKMETYQSPSQYQRYCHERNQIWNKNDQVPTPLVVRDRIQELKDEIKNLELLLSPNSESVEAFRDKGADNNDPQVDYSTYRNNGIVPKRKKIIKLKDLQVKPKRRKKDDDESYEEGTKKTSKEKNKKRQEESDDEVTEDDEYEEIEEEVVVKKRKTMNSNSKPTNRKHRIDMRKKVTSPKTPSTEKNKDVGNDYENNELVLINEDLASFNIDTPMKYSPVKIHETPEISKGAKVAELNDGKGNKVNDGKGNEEKGNNGKGNEKKVKEGKGNVKDGKGNEENVKKGSTTKTSKWEIPVDKTKEYWTIQKLVLNKDYGEYEYEKICNHKKEFFKPAVFLVLWNSGQREWTAIEHCVVDGPALVIEYMEENNLDYDKLGYDGDLPVLPDDDDDDKDSKGDDDDDNNDDDKKLNNVNDDKKLNDVNDDKKLNDDNDDKKLNDDNDDKKLNKNSITIEEEKETDEAVQNENNKSIDKSTDENMISMEDDKENHINNVHNNNTNEDEVKEK